MWFIAVVPMRDISPCHAVHFALHQQLPSPPDHRYAIRFSNLLINAQLQLLHSTSIHIHTMCTQTFLICRICDRTLSDRPRKERCRWEPRSGKVEDCRYYAPQHGESICGRCFDREKRRKRARRGSGGGSNGGTAAFVASMIFATALGMRNRR